MGNTLGPNQALTKGQRLTSNNGTYFAEMQASDGNFCVYRKGTPNQFLWGTMKLGNLVKMQGTPILGEYDSSQNALWNSSATFAGNGLGFACMMDDGKLTVFRGLGTFASNFHEPN